MSTVLVDDRTGSKDLWPRLQAKRISSKLARLEFGDVQIVGRGPDERPVLVGLEIKAPGDLLQSLGDGRLAGHQLPGLVTVYEIVYLVVEGLPVLKPGGKLGWAGKRKSYGDWKYRSVIGQLTTFEHKLGVRYVFTQGRQGTADWIESQYGWWVGESWEKHRSHLTRHRIDPDSPEPWELFAMNPALERKRDVAMALADGMGYTRAMAAAKHFRSVEEMVCGSTEADWEKVPGVGKKLAARVMAEKRRI